MEIRFSIDSSQAGKTPTGPVKVGWLYTHAKSSILFEPPTRVRSVQMNKQHAKSASRCPAILGLESRYFEIKCPFDIEIAYELDPEGNPIIRNLLGEKSPVRSNKMRQFLRLMDQVEWRYPDRPTIQLQLPYFFVADEPVYITQLAPFLHYNKNPWPGTIFPGRFPAHIWPRPIMWAFEWHETDKPLILKRGEPLFYVTFETEPQDRSIQLVEAQKTPELEEYCEMITGVAGYVNQTFSLFKSAEERRPPKLLVPKER